MSAVAVADIPRETVAAYLAEIPVDQVDVATNVRADVGDLTELKASIEELGVLEPIVVTEQFGPKGKHGYRLVVGQRRLAACRELERLTIPAIVQPAGEVDEPGLRRSIEQLAENLIRKELNPIEEAVALRAVLDADPELTQAELARRLGMSAPWVSNALRLLSLDGEVQDKVRAGVVSASHAKQLVVLPAKDQRYLAGQIEGGVSAHQLENSLRWKIDEAKNAEARATRTVKWLPKLVPALEAAGVGTDTKLYLTGMTYNLDVPKVEAALRKAGYSLHPTYVWDRGEGSKCDCKVAQLTFNRTWQTKPGCIDDRHHDRQRNVDQQARREAEERRDRRVAAIRGAFEKDLRARLEGMAPQFIRLLERSTVSYRWGAEPDDRLEAIARNAVAGNLTDDELTQLFTDLGIQDPEQAIEATAPEPVEATPAPERPAKAARKAKTGTSAPHPIPTGFTPAQAAAAALELGLDGAD